MPSNLLPESLMYAVYFAPRGKERLLNLGHQIAQDTSALRTSSSVLWATAVQASPF